jgi:hypothetical protein
MAMKAKPKTKDHAWEITRIRGKAVVSRACVDYGSVNVYGAIDLTTACSTSKCLTLVAGPEIGVRTTSSDGHYPAALLTNDLIVRAESARHPLLN